MRCSLPLLPLLLAATGARPAAAAPCESLAALRLRQTTITSAELVPPGGWTPPAGRAKPDLPPFCRVIGTAKPTKDSDIRFEVWMPASSWNGKFRGAGNGGFAGTIAYRSLEQAVQRGYAGGSTDTGHHTTVQTDGSWAIGHPEKVVDFGHRGIHEMTDRSKAIVRAFYGRPASKSYFLGCSNGGRQALMEAQRYPGDYDGIVAGAPANAFTRLLTQGTWEVQKLSAAYLPPAKLPAIEAATRAACDAADGLTDGVLDDPRRCAFDPAAMLCKGPPGADRPDCLTAAEAATLQSVFAGPRTRAGLVHPGRLPGALDGPESWSRWITGPAPGKGLQAEFSASFFRNLVFEKPDWDPATFDLERDFPVAHRKLARHLDATDPDLRPFARRGGKLILYHGWNDPPISPLNTVDYYEKVLAKVGTKTAAGFVRLFMAPGVLHCDGGPGPGNFSGAGALHPDADHDVTLAIERWVEQGLPPARIVAARYKTDKDRASGVLRTRPLCPYPQVARWDGKGSQDEAASFACGDPPR